MLLFPRKGRQEFQNKLIPPLRYHFAKTKKIINSNYFKPYHYLGIIVGWGGDLWGGVERFCGVGGTVGGVETV